MKIAETATGEIRIPTSFFNFFKRGNIFIFVTGIQFILLKIITMKTKKQVFILSLYLLMHTFGFSFGQADDRKDITFKKNSIYIEGGGIARLSSIYFERTFLSLGSSHFSFRTGMGTALVDFSFPVLGLSYSVGTRNHFMEFGLSGARMARIYEGFFNDRTGSYLAVSPSLGIKRTYSSDFFLYLGATPIINVMDPNAVADRRSYVLFAARMGWGF